MEGWERVQYIMKSEGLNKNSFSKAIGLTNNVTITRIINEKRTPSQATCQKIIKHFPEYRLEWLMHGVGEPLEMNLHSAVNEPATHYQRLATARPVENIGFMNVPIVHIRAQCGYLDGFGDEEYIENLPTLPVIVDRTYRGKYRLFEADGDSMDDGTRQSICDGDIVLAREVNRSLWRSHLHIRDWYFIIVHHTDGITIKQIKEHDVQNGIITCHPLNPLFEDYDIRLDDVAELYNLIKIVDRNARL
ncbi:MAG: helix-turn-helix domain-containing protein [Bacteroides sp.]|nr:helix-turn-helix domain-containing protein [Bacteroides sp.]